MKEYIIKEGQTLLDVAIQLYGSVDYLVKLCVDNNLDMNDDVAGNTVVHYDVALFNLSPVATKLQLNDLFLATAGEILVNTQPELPEMLEHNEEEYTNEEHN